MSLVGWRHSSSLGLQEKSYRNGDFPHRSGSGCQCQEQCEYFFLRDVSDGRINLFEHIDLAALYKYWFQNLFPRGVYYRDLFHEIPCLVDIVVFLFVVVSIALIKSMSETVAVLKHAVIYKRFDFCVGCRLETRLFIWPAGIIILSLQYTS